MAVVYARMHRHILVTGLGTNGLPAMMRFDEVVSREPEILDGTPVFLGTRVPCAHEKVPRAAARPGMR
jgi:hypothetical protein